MKRRRITHSSILSRPLAMCGSLLLFLVALPVSVFAAGETLNQNLGTIASGKTVQVFYTTTVESTIPSGDSNISNQGAFTSMDSTAELTDDPAAVGANDPTLTTANKPAPAGPEIDVQGNAMSIAGDGTNVPAAADDTDFGNSPVGVGTAENTFVISNSVAGQTLNIGAIVLGGTNSGDFSLSTDPSPAAIVGVGSVNLGITFTPTAVGARSATVTIPNDDADEAPYVFNIAGFGDPPTDTTPPVISGAKDIVVTVETGLMSDPIFYAPTATDETAPAMPVVTCVPAPGGQYAAGTVTPVTCTATDAAGNPAMATFNIVVLVRDNTPGERFLDGIALRGDAATGATGTIFNINRAYLNNAGSVIYDATLSGAGTNNSAVFVGPAAGVQTAIAVKNTASGAGNYGNFSNLSLNDSGDAGFQSLITGAGPGHFADTGGGAAASAVKGGVAPVTGSPTFGTIHKPAMASNGELLTPASLQLGSGAGVTAGDDTVVTSSAATTIAREGDPTSVLLTSYGHLHPRVVASENNDRFAFTGFLNEPTFNPATNTGVFAGVLGGAPPAVIREGDAAAGTPGVFSTFMGEAVNSAGELVVRANASGTGITSSNNEGLWTNSGDTGSPPILVAREGDVAPCLPNSNVAFSRFDKFHISDDGSVCFFAFLKDATATPTISSANDGSIWRWSNGELHLIVQESQLGNNTDAAAIRTLSNFDCSGTGGVVYQATFSPGIGDALSSNNIGVYLDKGGADPAPLLILRRGDTFDLSGTERTVVGLNVSTEKNAGGGTGGYGRSINDMGSVLLNLTLSGGSSGIFVLGTAPPP